MNLLVCPLTARLWWSTGCDYCSLSKIRPPPFSLQVIARGHLLLESTPTQQTKSIGSSMHNNEICTVCVGLLYFILCVRDNKQTHSSSSSWRGRSRWAASWSGRSWEAASEEDAVREQQLKRTHSRAQFGSDHARLVLARDTTAQGASE